MKGPVAVLFRLLPAAAAFLMLTVRVPAETPPPAALSAKAQPQRGPDETPAGLRQSDWRSIREAHQAWRHSFQPAERGYSACTPGMGWRSGFDATGFLTVPDGGAWRWGL